MNQLPWNEAAVISALAAVLSWIYPPFICFIGVGGVCAATFGWYAGWINIAAYVYLMAGLVRQAIAGG